MDLQDSCSIGGTVLISSCSGVSVTSSELLEGDGRFWDESTES